MKTFENITNNNPHWIGVFVTRCLVLSPLIRQPLNIKIMDADKNNKFISTKKNE